VLETGKPVSMPWRDNVKAIIEAWFPDYSRAAKLAIR
jgi:beta-glucosidase